MFAGWLAALPAECSGLAECADVRAPDVESELARKLIAKPHAVANIKRWCKIEKARG